jgi:hypothetical protein
MKGSLMQTTTIHRPNVGDLFDDDARVRRTDPITSHEAADLNDTKRSIGLVLDILKSEGPKADHEIETLSAARGENFTGQRLRTARAALVKKGLVGEWGIYRMTPRNRRAAVWTVTS